LLLKNNSSSEDFAWWFILMYKQFVGTSCKFYILKKYLWWWILSVYYENYLSWWILSILKNYLSDDGSSLTAKSSDFQMARVRAKSSDFQNKILHVSQIVYTIISVPCLCSVLVICGRFMIYYYSLAAEGFRGSTIYLCNLSE
jgi:hypothetical protein